MAGVRWDGLDEWERDLQALPVDLATSAAALAESAATQAADAIRARYPRHSGHLAAGLTVFHVQKSAVGHTFKLVNLTRYAVPFEYGRFLGHHGQTRPRPTFIPIRNAYQRGYSEAILAMLLEHGLTGYGSYVE